MPAEPHDFHHNTYQNYEVITRYFIQTAISETSPSWQMATNSDHTVPSPIVPELARVAYTGGIWTVAADDGDRSQLVLA